MQYINNSKNYYTEYFIDELARPLIIISAGGGYQYTSPRESEPVAKMFNSNGYHVVICNYREDENEYYPIPGQNLAFVYKKYKNDVRATMLIGIGFSAGGHCLLEMTLHNNFYNVEKPDLLILGYPVITSDEKYSHKGSFIHLLGEEGYQDMKKREYVSLEKEIKENEPDLFLFGTITDESVDAENSIRLLKAYHDNKLNIEYHLFPYGGHGLSLATKEVFSDNLSKVNPYFAAWTKDCLKWLEYKIKGTVRK